MIRRMLIANKSYWFSSIMNSIYLQMKSHEPQNTYFGWITMTRIHTSSIGLANAIWLQIARNKFSFFTLSLGFESVVAKKWLWYTPFGLTLLFAHISNSPRISIYADTESVVTDKKSAHNILVLPSDRGLTGYYSGRVWGHLLYAEGDFVRRFNE